VEVVREPVDAGEDLQRREVEVGALTVPGRHDPIDLVALCGRVRAHPPIIPPAARWPVLPGPADCFPGVRAGERRRRVADLSGGPGGRGPPWCNGSTTAFGAVRFRFESWRRSM